MIFCAAKKLFSEHLSYLFIFFGIEWDLQSFMTHHALRIVDAKLSNIKTRNRFPFDIRSYLVSAIWFAERNDM